MVSSLDDLKPGMIVTWVSPSDPNYFVACRILGRESVSIVNAEIIDSTYKYLISDEAKFKTSHLKDTIILENYDLKDTIILENYGNSERIKLF